MKTTYSTLFGMLCGMWATPAPAMGRRLGKKDDEFEYDQNQVEYDQNQVDYDQNQTDYDQNMDYNYGDELDSDQDGGIGQGYGYDESNSTLDDDLMDDAFAQTNSTGSMDYGYVQAEYLYMNGLCYYDCDSLISGYWHDVQTIVFAECDSKWSASSMWSEYSHACKSGAEEFTMEKIGECFDVQDCADLGNAAGASVAGSFCSGNGLFHERKWLPSSCVLHAETSCKTSAVDMTQSYADDGVCSAVHHGSALDYADQLYPLCEQEVYEMEQAGKLTWR